VGYANDVMASLNTSVDYSMNPGINNLQGIQGKTFSDENSLGGGSNHKFPIKKNSYDL